MQALVRSSRFSRVLASDTVLGGSRAFATGDPNKNEIVYNVEVTDQMDKAAIQAKVGMIHPSIYYPG